MEEAVYAAGNGFADLADLNMPALWPVASSADTGAAGSPGFRARNWSLYNRQEFDSSLVANALPRGQVNDRPAGVGFFRTPRVALAAGDVVEVEVERVGTLRNPVYAA